MNEAHEHRWSGFPGAYCLDCGTTCEYSDEECNHVHLLVYIENMSNERIKVYQCSDCLNLFDVELKPLGDNFIEAQKGTKEL